MSTARKETKKVSAPPSPMAPPAMSPPAGSMVPHVAAMPVAAAAPPPLPVFGAPPYVAAAAAPAKPPTLANLIHPQTVHSLSEDHALMEIKELADLKRAIETGYHLGKPLRTGEALWMRMFSMGYTPKEIYDALQEQVKREKRRSKETKESKDNSGNGGGGGGGASSSSSSSSSSEKEGGSRKRRRDDTERVWRKYHPGATDAYSKQAAELLECGESEVEESRLKVSRWNRLKLELGLNEMTLGYLKKENKKSMPFERSVLSGTTPTKMPSTDVKEWWGALRYLLRKNGLVNQLDDDQVGKLAGKMVGQMFTILEKDSKPRIVYKKRKPETKTPSKRLAASSPELIARESTKHAKDSIAQKRILQMEAEEQRAAAAALSAQMAGMPSLSGAPPPPSQ